MQKHVPVYSTGHSLYKYLMASTVGFVVDVMSEYCVVTNLGAETSDMNDWRHQSKKSFFW